MIESNQKVKSDVWSVKSPNQLNLVVDTRIENVLSPSMKQHPLTDMSSVNSSPKDSQTNCLNSNKRKTTSGIDSTQRKSSQPNRKSNFIPTSTSRKTTKEDLYLKQKQSQVQTYPDDVGVRLPSFGPIKKRMHMQEASYETQSPHRIKNSFIPSKALGYLQFVDEPGIKDIVSKFDDFQHQSQFKKPLHQQTLYLQQVRKTQLRNQQNATQQFHSTQPILNIGSVNSPISTLAPSPFITQIDNSLFGEESRISKTGTSRRQRSNFFSTNQRHISEIDSYTASRNRQSPMQGNSVSQQGRRRRINHTSQVQYRNNLNPTIRAQIGAKIGRNQRLSQTSGGYGFQKGQILINENDPTRDSEMGTIQIGKQDSIESALPKDKSKGYKRQDPGYNQLVKEYVFYNINKQTYQPFYRETPDQQLERKRELFQSQLADQTNLSLSMYQPSQLQTDSVRQTCVNERNQVSKVISSALRVRNIDTIQARKVSLSPTTPDTLSDGFQSTGDKVYIESKVGSNENIVILTDLNTEPQQNTVVPSPISEAPDIQEGLKQGSDVNTVVNSCQQSLNPISPRLFNVENPIDVRVKLSKTKQAPENNQNREEDLSPANNMTIQEDQEFQELQTQKNHSNTASSIHGTPKERSMKASQSVSLQGQSQHNMTPIDVQIQLNESQFTNLAPENVSSVKDSTGQTQSQKNETEFVSGNMTIKPRKDQFRQDTVLLEGDDLKMINNMVKIKSQGTDVVEEPAVRESVETSNQQKEVKDNSKLKAIDSLVAQIEVNSIPLGTMHTSEVTFTNTNKGSATEYEEFRQAGIISPASQIRKDSAKAVDPNFDNKKQINRQSELNNQSQLKQKQMINLKNQSQNKQGGQIQTEQLQQRLHQIHKGEIYIQHLPDQRYSDEKNGQQRLDRSYVITQYSLPKALQAQQRNQSQPVSHNRQGRRQSQKRQPSPQKVQNTSIANSAKSDIEQFNYEMDKKKTLSGPTGRKLSKFQALKVLNKKNAAYKDNNIDRRSVANYSISQSTKRSVIPERSIFGENGSQISLINCTGGRISSIDSKDVGTLDVPQSITQRSSIEKGGHRITSTKTFSQEASLAKNDLSSVMYPDELAEQEKIKNTENGNQRVKVPSLKLKKVELQFNGDDQDALGQQYYVTSPQALRFLTAVGARFNNDGQLVGVRPKNVNIQDKLQQDKNDRQTRMISIDVQTDAKKNATHTANIKNLHKLHVIAQERSVQDTLYDGGDVISSQAWKSGVRLVDHHAELNGSKLRDSIESRGQSQGQRVKMEINSQNTAQICSVNNPTQVGIAVIGYDDNDLVNTGEAILAKAVESQHLIDPLVKSGGLPVFVKQADSVLNSAGQLPSNEPSKNIVTGNKDGENNSVQESQETDQGKYQHTFRQNSLDNQKSPETITKAPDINDYGSPDSPNKIILEGKYTVGLVEKIDTLVLSSGDGSIAHLSKKNKDSKKKKSVRVSNRDLGVVVKTVSAGRRSRSNISHQKSQTRVKDDGDKDEKFDPHYFRDRQEILRSNDEVNLEAIMKLRYSSDEDSQRGMKDNELVVSQGNATVTLGAKSSLNSAEQKILVQKILNNTSNSYNSSEYVALKMQQMEPNIDKSNVERGSSHMNVTNVSMDKTTIYQMQPMFQPPKSPNRSKRSKKSVQSRQSIDLRQDSVGTHDESNPDDQERRMNDYGGSPEGRDQMNIQQNQQYATDNNWLDRFCQSGMHNEMELQSKRDADQARRERILALKFVKSCQKRSREPTPPMSQNKLLQLPKKSHSRMKVGNIGKNNPQIESIWAKKRMEKTTGSQNAL